MFLKRVITIVNASKEMVCVRLDEGNVSCLTTDAVRQRPRLHVHHLLLLNIERKSNYFSIEH